VKSLKWLLLSGGHSKTRKDSDSKSFLLSTVNTDLFLLINNKIDKTRFNRELRQISAHLGNKSLKNYMRDEKGNLQLLPDEGELIKPKKPLTPYMLFVRYVSKNNV
jgi:hypothetical protein